MEVYTVPMNPGDPGLETWKNLDAARHGGGHRGCRAPTIRRRELYIFGTGNPTPAYTRRRAATGDNLYTCSLVAVNVDTGKMAWYYQTSPHDTHDWDSAQTPILVDGEFNGKPRKLVVTAAATATSSARSPHRRALVTSKFSDTANWAKGLNAEGPADRNPGEGPSRRRRAGLVEQRRRDQLAAAGVQPRDRAVLRADAPKLTRCTT